MHSNSIIETAPDGVVAALVHGLEIEFGRGAGAALAQRFLDAEECDFLWDARLRERWLCSFEGTDEDDIALDRIAILTRLDGRWTAATLIVDGEGRPHGLMGRRDFTRRQAAERAYEAAR